MKKYLLGIACVLLCLCLGSAALADGAWTCPGCGKTGLTGNFCGSCGTAKPVDTWTCPNCGKTGLTGNFCGHCGADRPDTAGEAHTITISSSVKGQTYTYTFTAARDGYCVLILDAISEDCGVNASVTDSNGEEILYSKLFDVENAARSSKQLEKGKDYTVNMKCWGSTGPDYTFKLYEARPVQAINGEVTDSMDYLYQLNSYLYTAPETGTYTIDLSDYSDDFYMMMTIKDSKGNTVTEKQLGEGWWSCKHYEVKLTAGTTYTITMEKKSGTGRYTFTIAPEAAPTPTPTLTATPTAKSAQGSTPTPTPTATPAPAQLVTGTSSSKLFKLLDQIGRTSDADAFCKQFNGITVRENNVDYSSFLRTSFVSFSWQSYSFTEMKVDFSKSGHKLLDVVILISEDGVSADIEQMLNDGALVRKANGTYIAAPEDGAYTLKFELNSSVSMFSSTRYYQITVTR